MPRRGSALPSVGAGVFSGSQWWRFSWTRPDSSLTAPECRWVRVVAQHVVDAKCCWCDRGLIHHPSWSCSSMACSLEVAGSLVCMWAVFERPKVACPWRWKPRGQTPRRGRSGVLTCTVSCVPWDDPAWLGQRAAASAAGTGGSAGGRGARARRNGHPLPVDSARRSSRLIVTLATATT